MRQQIESFVVRRGLSEVHEDAIEEVESALQALKQACDSGNVAEIAKADVGFHEAILQACGGDDFLPIWKWLCTQMLLTYSRLDDFQEIHDEHAEILAALKKGRKQAVVSALKANIC